MAYERGCQCRCAMLNGGYNVGKSMERASSSTQSFTRPIGTFVACRLTLISAIADRKNAVRGSYRCPLVHLPWR